MLRSLPLPTLALSLTLGHAALAQVPAVVADLPIAQSLTAMVMGDLGTPGLLLDQGGDPHNTQLRPSQARAVVQADLLVWTSGVLSPWMQDVVTSLAAGETLELAAVEGVRRQPFATGARFAPEDEEHDDHGHDDHAHDDHGHDDHDHADHGHDDHDHADAPYDPHLWLEPDNATVWLNALAARLAGMDPANAATYRANAAAAAQEIAQLRREIEATLAPARGVGLVMHHDAYGYLAQAFDLRIVGTIAGGDAADPGAAHIAALRAEIERSGATCLFPEVNHPAAFAATVAEGSPLRIGAALDPAGVMVAPGPGHYAETLRTLAAAIAACATAG